MEAPVELLELRKTEYKMEETNLLDSDLGLFRNVLCVERGFPFVKEHNPTDEITH
jgi:hypothetical protein